MYFILRKFLNLEAHFEKLWFKKIMEIFYLKKYHLLEILDFKSCCSKKKPLNGLMVF